MTDDGKPVRARTIDADSLASWGASWDAGVDVPDDVVGGIIDYAEQLLRKTRADDRCIAELTAERDEARADAEAKAHRVAELGALLDQVRAELNNAVAHAIEASGEWAEALARAERAEAVLADVIDWAHGRWGATSSDMSAFHRILDGADTEGDR